MMPGEYPTQARLAERIPNSLFSPDTQLSRVNCGPCSTASAINYMWDFPIITTGEHEQGVQLGDIVSILRNYDGDKITVNDQPYLWGGITDSGESYFGALRTILEAFRFFSETKTDFSTINDFSGFLSPMSNSSERNTLLLSVSSFFTTDITQPLQHNPSCTLGNGSHIITILNYCQETELYTVYDPMGNGQTFEVEQSVLDTYINLHPRGFRQAIAIATDKESLAQLSHLQSHETPVHPIAIVEIRTLICSSSLFNAL